MKIWKLFGLILLGVLAVLLVYPGIPAGANLNSRPSERYAMLTCYYLHWDGIHRKEIDMSHAYVGSGITMTNAPCFQNWF